MTFADTVVAMTRSRFLGLSILRSQGGEAQSQQAQRGQGKRGRLGHRRHLNIRSSKAGPSAITGVLIKSTCSTELSWSKARHEIGYAACSAITVAKCVDIVPLVDAPRPCYISQ